MSRSDFTRRNALFALAGLGVSVDFLATRAYAAVDGALAKKKVIVVICRGGMDGLSVAPPVGDGDYAGLRRTIALPGFGQTGGALPLDGTFGLHPALASVHKLALAGQARIAPAVASPDRARSHFEAQDVLESGGSVVYGTPSGWLNRSLEALGPERRVSALSVGTTAPLILRGKVQAASWSPGGQGDRDTRLPGILQDLYANDPLLGPALASGLATEEMAQTAMAATPRPGSGGALEDTPTDMAMDSGGAALRPILRQGLPQARALGTTLAGFMTQEGGPQIAAVSIDGFDTHANQGSSQGQLATRLAYLDAILDGTAKGLGPAWNDTVLMVVTEFGRTAKVNGTAGTDHGTASTALVMGGALKRGGIIGDWPTLAQPALFEARDTRPTLDMRALFKGVMAGHMGVARTALDTLVFPDSGAIAPVTGLV